MTRSPHPRTEPLVRQPAASSICAFHAKATSQRDHSSGPLSGSETAQSQKSYMEPQFRGPESSEYVYKPLHEDEIRLLALLPGSFDDDIHIRITHAPFLVPEMTKVTY